MASGDGLVNVLRIFFFTNLPDHATFCRRGDDAERWRRDTQETAASTTKH